MKFLRTDNHITFCGEHPIDRNNPEQAATDLCRTMSEINAAEEKLSRTMMDPAAQ